MFIAIRELADQQKINKDIYSNGNEFIKKSCITSTPIFHDSMNQGKTLLTYLLVLIIKAVKIA